MAAAEELRRLGGLEAVLTMLQSRKVSIRETAALVFASSSHENDAFCCELFVVAQSAFRAFGSALRGIGDFTCFVLHLKACRRLRKSQD